MGIMDQNSWLTSDDKIIKLLPLKLSSMWYMYIHVHVNYTVQ